MDVIVRVVIRGRVQGIGYRAWTEITALEHGLEGWVRNCRDGSVEAVFAGPKEVVLAMIELCRQGPPGARVDDIDQRAARSDGLGAAPSRRAVFGARHGVSVGVGGGAEQRLEFGPQGWSTSAIATCRPRSASEVTP